VKCLQSHKDSKHWPASCKRQIVICALRVSRSRSRVALWQSLVSAVSCLTEQCACCRVPQHSEITVAAAAVLHLCWHGFMQAVQWIAAAVAVGSSDFPAFMYEYELAGCHQAWWWAVLAGAHTVLMDRFNPCRALVWSLHWRGRILRCLGGGAACHCIMCVAALCSIVFPAVCTSLLRCCACCCDSVHIQIGLIQHL